MYGRFSSREIVESSSGTALPRAAATASNRRTRVPSGSGAVSVTQRGGTSSSPVCATHRLRRGRSLMQCSALSGAAPSHRHERPPTPRRAGMTPGLLGRELADRGNDMIMRSAHPCRLQADQFGMQTEPVHRADGPHLVSDVVRDKCLQRISDRNEQLCRTDTVVGEWITAVDESIELYVKTPSDTGHREARRRARMRREVSTHSLDRLIDPVFESHVPILHRPHIPTPTQATRHPRRCVPRNASDHDASPFRIRDSYMAVELTRKRKRNITALTITEDLPDSGTFRGTLRRAGIKNHRHPRRAGTCPRRRRSRG